MIKKFGLVTVLVLMVPLISMQFSTEVNWNLFDFIVMGILVFGTGLIYQFLIKKFGKANRLVISIIVGLAFLYIWAELAVGVFTNLGS